MRVRRVRRDKVYIKVKARVIAAANQKMDRQFCREDLQVILMSFHICTFDLFGRDATSAPSPFAPFCVIWLACT